MKIYEKGKKGDIAINAVMIGLITIASIFLLLMLFSLRMPAFAKQMYCKTFFHLHSASFMPEALRQDQDYCREQTALETYEIKPQDVIMRGLLNGGTSRRFDFIASNQFFQIGIEKKMEISKFSFALSGNASSIKIDVCPDGIIDFNITDMVPERKYYTDKALFDAFVNCSAKCHSFPCNVDFQIYVSDGYAVISEIELVHRECLLSEEIASNIIACWEKVNFGSYSESMRCKALSIKNCEIQQVSEKNITDILIGKKLCPIFGNAKMGCGEENNLDWNVTSIKQDGVLLVEFVKGMNAIRVS